MQFMIHRSRLRLLSVLVIIASAQAFNTVSLGGVRRKRLAAAPSLLFSSSNGGKDDESDRKLPSDDELFEGSSFDAESSGLIFGPDGDDDDEALEEDEYEQAARSEFVEDSPLETSVSLPSSLARASRPLGESPVNWSGALSTLRDRVEDAKSGRASEPANLLFRTITRERPNEAIGRFVSEADPQVVAAMTSTVSSLLGGLSNPQMGMETIVTASTEKLGNLCFQLMMTGYMFRNVEYLLALKSLMNLEASATLRDFREAFDRIDTDQNGFLDRQEIEALLADVYDGQPPAFEVETFLEFFDKNNDGQISWEEFERGFGNVKARESDDNGVNGIGLLPASMLEEDDEDIQIAEPSLSGTVEVELSDGKIIEVDAQEYVNDLKEQALALKRELMEEQGLSPSVQEDGGNSFINQAAPNPSGAGSIAGYIASLEGDVQSLTEGISPEVVDSMKRLVEFVLNDGRPETKGVADGKKEIELPGSALQQLALWQLVVGYRLRETEATKDWRQMME